jgi:hypothetical protein
MKQNNYFGKLYIDLDDVYIFAKYHTHQGGSSQTHFLAQPVHGSAVVPGAPQGILC